MRTKVIVILLAVLFALPLRGDTYLVVLADGAKAPDINAMGGQVLQQWSNRRLVELSATAAEQLQTDARIAYVQRIGSPTHRAQFKSSPNAAPPAWTTGIYAYDASGNIKTMGNDSFGYDRVGRLTTANVQGHAQAFTFDVYGNLTRLGDATLNVDAAKNQLSEWHYDNAGNADRDSAGRTYSYDPLGMVTAIDMTAADMVDDRRMIYTASDERIVIDEGPATARYRLRDVTAPRLLREWKSTGGGVLEWERDYLYAGPTLVAGEVQVDHDHDPMRHYHLDHLGSIRMVTDGTGELVSRHDYLPFGAELPPTTTEYENTAKAPRDPLKFTGHERDYFSLANVEGDAIDYMHARFYGAGRGRFMSVDPGKDWKPEVPQSWNLYAYVRNNPVRDIDPNGRRVHSVGGGSTIEFGVFLSGDLSLNLDCQGNLALTSTFALGGGGLHADVSPVYETTDVETVYDLEGDWSPTVGLLGQDIGIDDKGEIQSVSPGGLSPFEAHGGLSKTVILGSVNLKEVAHDVVEGFDYLTGGAVQKAKDAAEWIKRTKEEQIERWSRTDQQ